MGQGSINHFSAQTAHEGHLQSIKNAFLPPQPYHKSFSSEKTGLGSGRVFRTSQQDSETTLTENHQCRFLPPAIEEHPRKITSVSISGCNSNPLSSLIKKLPEIDDPDELSLQ